MKSLEEIFYDIMKWFTAPKRVALLLAFGVGLCAALYALVYVYGR